MGQITTKCMKKSRFLEMSDDTGRFIVKSNVTGISYYVEPIEEKDSPHIIWGDVNPATKSVEGSYGDKFKGSIKNSESLITPENGFENIGFVGVGTSPMAEIERRDIIHQENMKNEKK